MGWGEVVVVVVVVVVVEGFLPCERSELAAHEDCIGLAKVLWLCALVVADERVAAACFLLLSACTRVLFFAKIILAVNHARSPSTNHQLT
jgi:hypothetical protein